MEKRTLLFTSLENLAKFSKVVSVGFLMNTTNLSLTGYFTAEDILLAVKNFGGKEIKTTEKVYSYNKL